MKKSSKKGRIIVDIIIVILFVVFVVNAFISIRYYYTSSRDERMVEEIKEEIKEEETEETIDPHWQLLESYQKLHEQNNDFIGWIKIDNTTIDYPVMHTEFGRKDYYIHRNFNKQYSGSGLPYVQEECDPLADEDNIIIYGHHLVDGLMFTPLLNYYRQDGFYKDHQEICFNTLNGVYKYKVFACVVVPVNTGNDPYQFYKYIGNLTEEKFNQYVQDSKKRSRIKSDVEINYGDKLLTLVTCDYTYNDGRCIIVAVREKED